MVWLEGTDGADGEGPDLKARPIRSLRVNINEVDNEELITRGRDDFPAG
jgi:hypothetical protein